MQDKEYDYLQLVLNDIELQTEDKFICGLRETI